MALYNELPVYKATYDLLLEIFRFTANFNKQYKYTLGENLKMETLNLIKAIYRANSEADKNETLRLACEQVEVIRVQVRILKDLKQISLKSFIRINLQIENVSKQFRGWLKSQK